MNRNIQGIIVRVLQKNISEEEMHFFYEWFHSSEDNARLFFQLKQIYDCRRGGLYPDEDEMQISWHRLWMKLTENIHKTTPTPRRKAIHLSIKTIATIAAITIVIIVSTIFFSIKSGGSDRWVEVQNPSRSLPQIIELPDGSSVQLNASSYLKYPEKFKNNKREIYLNGEALFDVVKQQRKPFLVHSNKQRINVLGTKFNVMDYSVDAYSVTTLIDGQVELETFDAENSLKDHIVMNPDQQLYFDQQTGQVTLDKIDVHNTISWINGVYSFQDVPMQQIADRLGKMYGVTIVITDEKSRAEKYTGKFYSKQDIQKVIRIINFEDQFNYIMRNDTIIFQRK